jgi:RNA polymerase sigma-70 factor (ECF subfamily)
LEEEDHARAGVDGTAVAWLEAVSSPALVWPLGHAVAPPSPGGEALPRDEEREAIDACRRGEREAFDRLVLRYQRDVYRLCYRFVNNHDDANDLAQEAFLRAWRAIPRFRGESSFSTWLYRIAVNACLNFRALRRPSTQELPDAIADPVPGAEARLESEDEARLVRAAIARLPEKQRATLILKIYHELTHEEVAEILGSSVGTVKANLFHALGNLRRLVAGEGR